MPNRAASEIVWDATIPRIITRYRAYVKIDKARRNFICYFLPNNHESSERMMLMIIQVVMGK